MERRRFLQYTAVSGLGLLGGRYLYDNTAIAREPAPAVAGTAGYRPLLIPGDSGALGVLDISDARLTLHARTSTYPFIDGKPSPVLVYSGEYNGKEYVNPVLRIKKGGRFTARLQNDLDEPNIIHWHGFHIPGDMDGQPRSTIGPGERFDYTFTVPNRSGMYFYHTHAHHLTAKQAYFGQASVFMVEDEDEIALRNALQLEPGVTELVLVIQDKQFNQDGELIYNANTMQTHMGQLSDTILVNYTPQPQLDIANRLYRFRILNGSNSRIYKLAFVQGRKTLPYSIIGTDNGLLERAYTAKEQFLGPAERIDILFDASKLNTGDEVFLKSLAFDPLEGGSMDGMGEKFGGMTGVGQMGGATLDLGAEFEIMKLVVDRVVEPTPSEPPQKLSTVARFQTDGVTPRKVALKMTRMLWLINGESFDEGRFPLKSRRDSVEVWDLEHLDVSMPHPMHLHGFSFQVVSRRNSPPQVQELAQDDSGRVITDLGFKDTVLVWPGETVQIAIDFTHPYPGEQQYLFHCHNLEHEDQGMMVNHLITEV